MSKTDAAGPIEDSRSLCDIGMATETKHEFAVDLGLDQPLLYRYRRFDANEIRLLLTAGEIRFSDPAFFNDPWDCVPRIENTCRPSTDDEWMAIAERYRDMVAQEIPRDHWKYDEMVGDLSGNNLSELGRKRLESMFLEPADKILSCVRVLCLSEHADSPLMWAHYAQGHSGLCLVLSRGVVGSFVEAFKVRYRDQYPTVKYPLFGDILTRGLLCKPTYWEYEGEYRVLAVEPEIQGVSGLGGSLAILHTSHAGFVKCSPSALVGVILGARMRPEHEAELRKLLDCAKHSIEIWRARLDPHSYKVQVELESRTRGG